MISCSNILRFTDVIQNCVTLSRDGISHIVWDSNDFLRPCGTLHIKVLQGNIRYRINGNNNLLFPVTEGETVAVTIDDLRRVEFTCDDLEEICKIQFCLTIHYGCYL